MGFLYVTPDGREHRKHSYSAGLDFEQSPQKYYLRRVLGWKQKENKANLLFGKTLEAAVEFFHSNRGEGGSEHFIRNWSVYAEDKTITYTKTEKDWVSLNKTGTEMMKLYQIKQPSLPLPMGSLISFQREYSKVVFPSDPIYGDIEDAGRIDILAHVRPDHPLLPKVEWKKEYGKLRPLIVDIKTSAVDFPEMPGIAGFDSQLRRYSWLSGIRDVSLLWFKKTSHRLSKSASVSLLETVGSFSAGDEAVVALLDQERDGLWIVRHDFLLDELDASGGLTENGQPKQTKEAKAARLKWLEEFGVFVTSEQITRQRLQFNAGFVTQESADGAGQIAARQIVDIVNAWNTNQWPSNFGVRFPKNDIQDPYFRAFVLNDEAYRKENFVKSDDEALDSLFEEQEQGEE
jgi:hypothetical protein